LTYGCSTNIYMHRYCKFGKSDKSQIRKFALKGKPALEEETLSQRLSSLGDATSHLLRSLAPDCYNNMALFGKTGCRIGETQEKPYSGVTCVLDFCAHAHKDDNNMVGGCTAIVTLTKDAWKRDDELKSYVLQAKERASIHPAQSYEGCSEEITEESHPLKFIPNLEDNDEQYHVLPFYRPHASDEEIRSMVESGGLEIPDLNPADVPNNIPNYFQEMGGVGFSLPHGSLLLEVAKHELHATTSLKNPNRFAPSRIGLVYYTHHGLHVPMHGERAVIDQDKHNEHNKYLNWLNKVFIPSGGEIKTLKSAGYIFPLGVKFKQEKNRKGDSELTFNPDDFPGFQSGKWLSHEGYPDLTYPINPTQDRQFSDYKLNLKKFLNDHEA